MLPTTEEIKSLIDGHEQLTGKTVTFCDAVEMIAEAYRIPSRRAAMLVTGAYAGKDAK